MKKEYATPEIEITRFDVRQSLMDTPTDPGDIVPGGSEEFESASDLEDL